MMRIEWMSGMRFEAARRYAANQSHHGHSFLVNARGMGLDLQTLREALRDTCETWHYQDLSQLFASPDDATLAQALSDGLQQRLGSAHDVSLRSAPDCGIERTAEGGLTRWLQSEFSAAHFLPNVPEGHQCGRLHGHGFKIRLLADAAGCSQLELLNAWQPLRDTLHNAYLNKIIGLENPTSEALSEWLWQRLRVSLSSIRAVEVFETRTAGSRRDEHGWTIWKEQCFEAAQPLDEQGRYTGHSYMARLYLSGMPDPQAGWLRDFADVKAIFKPLYQQLDHYALDEVAGLQSYDCANIAQWMARQLSPDLPELSRVEVFENDYDGARWSAL
jgi:6-pyruvoyltetrahydropterin/6-carboxytetrahydropterin synthase